MVTFRALNNLFFSRSAFIWLTEVMYHFFTTITVSTTIVQVCEFTMRASLQTGKNRDGNRDGVIAHPIYKILCSL
jgi:hypothetical protein